MLQGKIITFVAGEEKKAIEEANALLRDLGDKATRNGLLTFADKIIIWYEDSEPGDNDSIVSNIKALIEGETREWVNFVDDIVFWKAQNAHLMAQKKSADDKMLDTVNANLNMARINEERARLHLDSLNLLLSMAENGEVYLGKDFFEDKK